MPRNGHFRAGFEVRQASNPDSVVGFVGNPSIFFGQVAIFQYFLLNSLFLNRSSERVALHYSLSTFTPFCLWSLWNWS
jgi:hypothetical protein